MTLARRLGLVSALLALACLVPAAELAWSGSPGAKPPPGWSVAAATVATVAFAERAIEISAASGQRALAIAACEPGDGSDERPLRLSATIAVAGERAVRGQPALLALEWAGGGVFAVGLGVEPASGEGRRTWAVWGGAGRPGAANSAQEMAPDPCPAHVRIILTSNQIIALGSRDGWSWSRVAAVPRASLGATAAPVRVLVGRGQPKEGAAGLAADPPGDAAGKPCLYRFTDLAVDRGSAEVPSALLRTYAKQESLADTVAAFLGDRLPRQWRLRGPEDPNTVLPDTLPAGFLGTGTWKPFTLAANDRIIPLGAQLPDGNRLRWAACEVTVAQAGLVRFRFDGLSACRLWVDGRILASMPWLVDRPDPERYAAAAWLSAGAHQVVLATVGEAWASAAALTWEQADPLQRIALLRRLAVDFTGDEQLAEAPVELAHLWEGLGFPRQAAEELLQLTAADAETAQSALAERFRLLRQAGDNTAADAAMAALRQQWRDGGVDAVVTARRSAKLWQRLDDPQQAAMVLAEALKLPGLDARTRCSLAMERARLRRALGDLPGTASEMRAAAELLPKADGVRFELLCEAALLDPTTPAAALAELATQATDQLRARRLGAVFLSRKDDAARLAVRRAGAALPGPALASLAVELAEERATAGDQTEALRLYQAELARRGLPAAGDLAQARAGLVRGVLGGTPAGAALLAESGRLPALAGAIATAGSDRPGAQAALVRLADEALNAGRSEIAWALARTVLACWPEHGDLACRAISQWHWQLDAAARVELIAWFDQIMADRWRDNAWWQGWLQDNIPGQLAGLDLVDEALARASRTAITALAPQAVAGAHLREADILLQLGLPDRAAAAAQRALDAAPDDQSVQREAGRRRDLMHRRKGGRLAVAENIEVNNLLRTADRAMASDPARAAQDLQRAIEGAADVPVRLSDGRLRGLTLFATARLRAADEAVRQAWQEQQGGRADEALHRLDADQPQSLSALAARWPLSAAAAEARRREADLWASRGAWQLAAGTALRSLAEQPGANERHLLLRAAHASARLGDASALAARLAQLARLGGTWPWDARQVDAAGLGNALRSLLPPAAVAPTPARAGLIVRLPPQILAMRPETVADARPPLPAAVLDSAGLLVATPDDLACVGEDGAMRWLLAPTVAPMPPRPPAVPGTGAAALAVDGGVVVACLRSDGGRRLVAVETASGRRLWSSGGIAGLEDASVASAPLLACGRVWAWFLLSGRDSQIVCLDARDGTLLWRSTLGLGPQQQPIGGGGDYLATGDAPAPMLDGRELFVATDAGLVGAFDAVDGSLRWLHAYARSTLDLQDPPQGLRRLMARGRGVLLVDAERIYLAPRDAIGMFALDRAGGGVAWADGLGEVHELVGLAGEGLVALGPAITLHDRASGALRWRWRPASGERPGRPALVDGALWVPLRFGPLRLALADGAVRQGPAWSALGLGGPAAGLLVSGGRLLALADGLVALPVPEVAQAAETVVAGRPAPPVPLVAVAAAPTTLARQWELPLGRVLQLFDVGGGECYARTGDRLHRVDAASGQIIWSMAAAGEEILTATCAEQRLYLRCTSRTVLLDRASGRLLASVPLDRDPMTMLARSDRWRWQQQPAGAGLLRTLTYDRRVSLVDPADGHALWRINAAQNTWGALVSGAEVHLLTIREGRAVMEVRRLADGGLIKEVPLGGEGLGQAWLHPRPDGGGLILLKDATLLWDPHTAAVTRSNVVLEGLHRITLDEGNLNILGSGSTTRMLLAAPDGRQLATEDITGWTTLSTAMDWAPRLVAGRRVRFADREGQVGIHIRAMDGSELAWLPTGGRWQRAAHGVVPLDQRAVGFATDRENLLHVLLIDPTAGKLLAENTFAVSLVEGVAPVAHADGVVVATNRGLLRLVPATSTPTPPGRAFAETPMAVWRMPAAPVLDGELAEWAGQQGWLQPAAETGRGAAAGAPLLAWVGWRDEGLAFALRTAQPPWRLPQTTIALEAVRDGSTWNSEPLLLGLSWQGGVGRCTVLHCPASEDAKRQPVLAHVASDGISMTWEVVVPWAWLYPAGEQARHGAWLRFAAALTTADGAGALECGAALVGGLDKSGMARLQLLDARPPVDPKATTPVSEPPKPPTRR